MKIDTSNWKKFKISDLFDVSLPRTTITKDNGGSGNTPFVSACNTNNGIERYISEYGDGNSIITKKNTFTINMFGHMFWHWYDFYAQRGGTVTIVRPKFETNKMISSFICAIVNKTMENKYDYGRQCHMQNINDTIIPLPVTSDGSPDWQYMESYMQNLWDKIEITFKKENNNNRIDTSEWKKFKISDLFEVQNGKCGSSNNRDGSIAIINAGTINNGVLGYFDVEPKYENRITIVGQGDGGTGKAFYHNYKFNATSCVRVLIEKFEGMNKYIALFLCTILTKSFFNTGKYNFSNGLGKAKLEAEEILLPVTSDGTPDWQYMEDFMRDIESRSVLIQAIKERAM